MLELIIIATCLGNYECPTLTSAYLQHNTTLKQNIYVNKKKLEKTVGKEKLVIIATTYKALYGSKIKLKLPKNILLEIPLKEDRTLSLVWRKDF